MKSDLFLLLLFVISSTDFILRPLTLLEQAFFKTDVKFYIVFYFALYGCRGPTLCDPWTVAHQAPPSMGFSRQEYWSGLPFPSPGESSQPRDRTQVSRIAGRRFNRWATREAHNT